VLQVRTQRGLTLVPFAVGDGRAHTLYVNNDDATSSIFPLNETHNVCFNHLSELRTVRTEQIPTRCLDDLLPDGVVDFLKLDVQGAELLVLQGADRTLSRTAVVHSEVEFSPIYLGQPLFSDVERHLRARDFTLIDLVISGRYHYLTPSRRVAEDRLLWADAVFFRETDDPATQRVQALVAASVYRKPTLAEHLLVIAERSSFSRAVGEAMPK
jgi:FkbM family methyltransferase